jgi:hypothetical protein
LSEAISFAASSSGERAEEGGRGSAEVEESAGSTKVVSVGEVVCGCLALAFDEDICSTLQQKGEKFEKKVKRSEVWSLIFTQGGWDLGPAFEGEGYFLRNLLKRLPGLAGAGAGAAPSEGRGKGDLTALAGTAMGVRVVALVGRAKVGRALEIPEGRGVGRGIAEGADPG